MKNGTASLWIFGLLMLPGTALAGNWGEAWGTMAWGLPVSVPSLPGIGLIALAIALSATAAWLLRKRRTALGLPVLLVLLAVPLVVVAGTVSVPNAFVNGEVADADLVNENFDAVETAVNDNDSRLLAVETDTATAQSTADTAELDAAAAQSTADTAVTDAAAALSTADAAATDAAAALITADTALADAGEAQSTADAAAAGHTVNTNTQLTNAQVAAAATAQGFVTGAHTTDSNTQLDEAAVDGFVANNGFGLAADVSANTAAIASLGGAVTGLQACADGLTVADHDTGLLWEKKTGTPVALPGVVCETAGCPDPHDVANAYEWSNVSPDPNGGAFTDFLAKLNDSSQPATWSTSSYGSVGTQTSGCFADHCDWRLPNIVELKTILDCSFGNPCIDPLFGPTGSSAYWSASSDAASSLRAWLSNFIGASGVNTKSNDFFVRAVRAGSCTD